MGVVPIMVREDGDQRNDCAATLTHITIHQLADERTNRIALWAVRAAGAAVHRVWRVAEDGLAPQVSALQEAVVRSRVARRDRVER